MSYQQPNLPPTEDHPCLPDGWSSHFDGRSQRYYYSNQDGLVTWDRPSKPKPSTPPPPSPRPPPPPSPRPPPPPSPPPPPKFLCAVCILPKIFSHAIRKNPLVQGFRGVIFLGLQVSLLFLKDPIPELLTFGIA